MDSLRPEQASTRHLSEAIQSLPFLSGLGILEIIQKTIANGETTTL